jgi:hypothetical protein
MSERVTGWLAAEAWKKLSVLSTAAQITFRPAFFAEAKRLPGEADLRRAMRFFLASVGIVLAIEAAFSLAFATAFSDIVHHSFPILVVLAGGITMYVLLKVLLARNVSLAVTMDNTLFVGGAALLVMISVIFTLLTVDFLVSYNGVLNSPCAHRTIICLLSGGSLTEYDVPPPQQGALGTSFPFIILVMLASAVHYSRVLAKVLKATMGVAAWRTYIAAAVSLVLLTPLSLGTINAVYRVLYR